MKYIDICASCRDDPDECEECIVGERTDFWNCCSHELDGCLSCNDFNTCDICEDQYGDPTPYGNCCDEDLIHCINCPYDAEYCEDCETGYYASDPGNCCNIMLIGCYSC